MKLSEDIVLGSTLIPMKRRNFNGCAWGMVAASHGQVGGAIIASLGEDWAGWEKISKAFGYPWAGRKQAQFPCECWSPGEVPTDSVASVIAHLFDFHVCIPYNIDKWTLEQLAYWFHTQEPEEPSVQCEEAVEGASLSFA